MAKKTDIVETKEECGVAVLREAESAELVATTLRELGGTAFDLGQLRVPSGGGLAWTYETSGGPQVARHLDVVIAMIRSNLRKWYREPFGEGEGGPPSCASEDGVTGRGNNTLDADAPVGVHDCASCPWSVFGSDRVTESGKDCSEYMLAYVFRIESLVPEVLSIPPTSLKVMRKFALALAGEGKKLSHVVVRLSLEKADRGGFPTAIIKPTMLRALTESERKHMVAVVAAVAQNGARQSAGAAPAK